MTTRQKLMEERHDLVQKRESTLKADSNLNRPGKLCVELDGSVNLANRVMSGDRSERGGNVDARLASSNVLLVLECWCHKTIGAAGSR